MPRAYIVRDTDPSSLGCVWGIYPPWPGQTSPSAGWVPAHRTDWFIRYLSFCDATRAALDLNRYYSWAGKHHRVERYPKRR